MTNRLSLAAPLGAALAVAMLAFAPPSSAEAIKVGIMKVGASSPVYITQDRGYFKDQGLDVQLVDFGAGQAVAVAVVSGAVDIGVTGLTAGLYNMVAHHEIRVVSGLHREAHGFHMLGYFASQHAWDSGLHSFQDFPGHSVAITTIGSTTHYALGLLAEHFGFPLSSVRIKPMQNINGSAAAVIGNQADVGMIPSTFMAKMNAAHAHLIGWVGDVTPWQIGAVFVATKTADTRHDMIEHFLAAMRKGVHDYYDAFTGPDGTRKDGPTAPAMLAIVSKYLGVPPEKLENEMPYVDPGMRIDLADINHQIAWYRAQGMVKGEVTAKEVVDLRYAPLMNAQK